MKQHFSISEPGLKFAFEQEATDPRVGLTYFGPFDLLHSSHPKSIRYGAIGTNAGLCALKRFANLFSCPIISSPPSAPWLRNRSATKEKQLKNMLLWPPFPGFKSAFGCEISPNPSWQYEIKPLKLREGLAREDPYQRTKDTVNVYLDAIRIASESDEDISVIICVEPDDIREQCRNTMETINLARSIRAQRTRHAMTNNLNLFTTDEDQSMPSFSVDFRKQLKARSMQFDIPIQIVRESTLDPLRPNPKIPDTMTILSDRAWNLSTTLFYKAGGKPWKLSTARDGVCYVGLVFKRPENAFDDRTACCAAQMFLDSGAGIVFRGAVGKYYSVTDDSYHLGKRTARDLMEGVLRTYKEQGGDDLREIFLHSRSDISKLDFEGYCEAIPRGVKVVGIRIRRNPLDDFRVYRLGSYPIPRGSTWLVSNASFYLWASGFKPDILCYDGWEVPVPLRVDVQHNFEEPEIIARDIMGLTKLNYNACRFGDSEPVTIGFSDAVGDVLVNNLEIDNPKAQFKYYI